MKKDLRQLSGFYYEIDPETGKPRFGIGRRFGIAVLLILLFALFITLLIIFSDVTMREMWEWLKDLPEWIGGWF